MLAKLKTAAVWVWEWITVIAALLVGALPLLIAYIDQGAAVGIEALLPPEMGLKIVAAVAAVKWACVGLLFVSRLIVGQREPPAEEDT